jgi:hypothetical protein
MTPGIGSGDRSITLAQSVNQIVPKTISEIPAAFRIVAIVVVMGVNVETRPLHIDSARGAQVQTKGERGPRGVAEFFPIDTTP